MEHCKISILLNNSTVSEFVTKKWFMIYHVASLLLAKV